MGQRLKQQAEQIFAEKLEKAYSDFGFPKSHSKCLLDEWIKKRENKDLLEQVIIPSIVQALEMITDEDILFDHVIETLNPASKIQPGQKLKEGDYFVPESIDQLKQIRDVAKVGYNWQNDSFLELSFRMEPYYSERFDQVIFNSGQLNFAKTEYTFADFRQLCVNTFGDGE